MMSPPDNTDQPTANRASLPNISEADAQASGALPAETLAFLNALYPGASLPGLIELRLIHRVRGSKPINQLWVPNVSAIMSVADKLLSANADDFHIFYGPGLRYREGGEEDDVTSIPALWADLDAKDFDEDDIEHGKRLARETLRSKLPAEFQPSILVDSGRGFHPYWLLHNLLILEEQALRQRVKMIMAGLGDLLNGDYVHDLGRVLRLPGTLNIKDPAQPRLCTIEKSDYARRFEISAFERFAIPLDRIRKADAVVFDQTLPKITLDGLRVSQRIRALVRDGNTNGK